MNNFFEEKKHKKKTPRKRCRVASKKYCKILNINKLKK